MTKYGCDWRYREWGPQTKQKWWFLSSWKLSPVLIWSLFSQSKIKKTRVSGESQTVSGEGWRWSVLLESGSTGVPCWYLRLSPRVVRVSSGHFRVEARNHLSPGLTPLLRTLMPLWRGWYVEWRWDRHMVGLRRGNGWNQYFLKHWKTRCGDNNTKMTIVDTCWLRTIGINTLKHQCPQTEFMAFHPRNRHRNFQYMFLI